MNLAQELAAARDRVAHLEALAKREFLSPDATPAERVDFALKQPHMRQIGPNPLPDGNSLWDQFSHLKNYTEAGYTGYLDYKTFRAWLADFIVAATPGELRNRE